jgi:hypothetical protein
MSDISFVLIPVAAVVLMGVPAFLWGGQTGLATPLLKAMQQSRHKSVPTVYCDEANPPKRLMQGSRGNIQLTDPILLC